MQISVGIHNCVHRLQNYSVTLEMIEGYSFVSTGFWCKCFFHVFFLCFFFIVLNYVLFLFLMIIFLNLILYNFLIIKI